VNGGSTKECYRARQPYGFDCSEGEANGTARVTDNMQILLVFLHCLRKQSWKSWMRFVVTPNNTIEVLIFWFLYHANQTLYYRIFIHLAIYLENCYLVFVLRFLREVYSC
jgi:hypothetical protein